jgi:hypothetical protein
MKNLSEPLQLSGRVIERKEKNKKITGSIPGPVQKLLYITSLLLSLKIRGRFSSRLAAALGVTKFITIIAMYMVTLKMLNNPTSVIFFVIRKKT